MVPTLPRLPWELFPLEQWEPDVSKPSGVEQRASGKQRSYHGCGNNSVHLASDVHLGSCEPDLVLAPEQIEGSTVQAGF